MKKTLRNIRAYINSWRLLLLAILIPSSSILGVVHRIVYLGVNLYVSKKSLNLVLAGAIFMIFKYFLYQEYELAQFGIITGIVATESIVKNRTKVFLSHKESIIILLFSTLMVFFNYYLKFDPNYLSFALLLTAIIMKISGHKFVYRIILILSIFLYSRLYIFTLILYVILDLLQNKSVIKRVKRPFLTTFIAYLVYLLLSGYLIFFILGGNIPEYIELSGFNRLSRLVDTSNWIRFTANFRMLTALDVRSLFFGFSGPIVFPEFPVKNIYPHNLYLGLAYNVGIFWSSIFLFKLTSVSGRVRSLFFPILFYQLVLGFGSYYMFVLPLLAIIVNTYEESFVNRG